MKYILIYITILISNQVFSQGEFKPSYLLTLPKGEMDQSLDNSHGFSLNLSYGIKRTGFFPGINFNQGVYASSTEKIDFETPDGNRVLSEMYIKNSYTNWNLNLQYNFLKGEGKGKRIIPFVEAGIGFTFFRTIFSLLDSVPESSCDPDPSSAQILQRDNALNFYAGTGIKIRLTSNEHSKCRCIRIYLTSSIGLRYGSNVSYMNVNNENGQSHHNIGSSEVDKLPFYSTWVNKQTQTEHMHHTGYTYTAPIRMLELKFGISLIFPPSNGPFCGRY